MTLQEGLPEWPTECVHRCGGHYSNTIEDRKTGLVCLAGRSLWWRKDKAGFFVMALRELAGAPSHMIYLCKQLSALYIVHTQ